MMNPFESIRFIRRATKKKIHVPINHYGIWNINLVLANYLHSMIVSVYMAFKSFISKKNFSIKHILIRWNMHCSIYSRWKMKKKWKKQHHADRKWIFIVCFANKRHTRFPRATYTKQNRRRWKIDILLCIEKSFVIVIFVCFLCLKEKHKNTCIAHKTL